MEGAATARQDGDTCGVGSATAGATSQLVGSTWVRTSASMASSAVGDGGRRLRGWEDEVGRADDALAGAAEDVGQVAVFGHGVQGPAGDVVEGVLAGVEAVGAGDHVRHGLGFHFEDPPALAALLVWVEEHVTGFVGEGLDGLGVVDVIADHDEPPAEVRVTVRATEVGTATHIESPVLEEALEAVP